jgi:transglutaminase-like putative cysteine protease
MGLPARYCSGYVHARQEVDLGTEDHGESHAWIEVLTGDWAPFDPSAGAPTDTRYVLVARGRDYADVAPVKGIFNGGPSAGLDVEVRITRIA